MSRTLCRILQQDGPAHRLYITSHGWCRIDRLLQKSTIKKRSEENVRSVLAHIWLHGECRFDLDNADKWVHATGGHSLPLAEEDEAMPWQQEKLKQFPYMSMTNCRARRRHQRSRARHRGMKVMPKKLLHQQRAWEVSVRKGAAYCREHGAFTVDPSSWRVLELCARPDRARDAHYPGAEVGAM